MALVALRRHRQRYSDQFEDPKHAIVVFTEAL